MHGGGHECAPSPALSAARPASKAAVGVDRASGVMPAGLSASGRRRNRSTHAMRRDERRPIASEVPAPRATDRFTRVQPASPKAWLSVEIADASLLRIARTAGAWLAMGRSGVARATSFTSTGPASQASDGTSVSVAAWSSTASSSPTLARPAVGDYSATRSCMRSRCAHSGLVDVLGGPRLPIT